MKKYILFILFPLLVINIKGKSQDTIGVSPYSVTIGHDTLPGGASDSISFWVKNNGSAVFNNNITFITYVQDSSGAFYHIVDTTYTAGLSLIAAKDSLLFSLSPLYDVVTPNKYHYDINVIVIWPVASATSTQNVLTYTEFLTVVPAGITEINLDKLIRAYPNPTTDKLIIENDGRNTIEEVRIYDAKGQLIKVIHNESIINTESWPKGMYIIDATTTNQKKQRFKVLKQ